MTSIGRPRLASAGLSLVLALVPAVVDRAIEETLRLLVPAARFRA